MSNDKPLSDIDNLRYYSLLHDANYECWADWLKLANIDEINASKGTIIDDTNVLIQAAVDGQGVGDAQNRFHNLGRAENGRERSSGLRSNATAR